ncbi:MAG: anthranilate synthase component I [Nitrososphaerota archaeon]|jgi:anthranilate synthase component 1|nr:anthranilate synthase component I [Nitrososphaerota archaeon]
MRNHLDNQTTKQTHTINYKKIPYTQQPFEIFSKLQNHYKNAYFLESIEGPKKLAQYSFIGFSPTITIQTKNNQTTIINEKTGKKTQQNTTDPLQLIQETLKPKTVHNHKFRLVGGAVGYISYDAVRYWEKLSQAKNNIDFPEIEMGIYDDGFIFDHTQQIALYYYQEENRLPEAEKTLKKTVQNKKLCVTEPTVNISKEHFESTVEKAKEYITAGDIFQVVLSKRYQFQTKGSLIPFYQALRCINPSPYMYYYKAGERQIVGASPEMLVRVDNRMVETFPIAGTTKITQDTIENNRLAHDLLSDPKERAEHVMLVDLSRNDVGKISKFGSVQVPEFMKVHQYSHVQHIVSQVVGELRDDLESFDALRSVFPAGTVSGAPKIRAMEIINELEPSQRGPYAGAVGYFSYNGNADFAITIRTLFANKDQAYIQAGAGIVADSIPEREWIETENKAKALMKAIETSGGI